MKTVFSSDSDISSDYSTIDKYNDDTLDFVPAHHDINKLLPSRTGPSSKEAWANAFKTADEAWATANNNNNNNNVEVGSDTDNDTNNKACAVTGPPDRDSARTISQYMWAAPAFIPNSPTLTKATPSPNTTLWATAAEIPDTPPSIQGYQHGTYNTPTYMNTFIPISPISNLHTPNTFEYMNITYLNDTLHTTH